MLSDIINLLPHNYSPTQWLILCLCAVFVGINKTGIPGIGIMVVPLLASFFPARISTGLLLPLLAMGDLFAVKFYHRHAKWNHILKLLPAALVGIAAGSLAIRNISDVKLAPVIGIIVLAMLILNYLRQRKSQSDLQVPAHWLFAVVMGFFAGLTTQLANAAGPVMIVYLLATRLPKYEFIGTSAWFFLIINWLKIPVFASEGRITLETVSADIVMLPLIAVGAFAGALILKKIPAKWFELVVQILAAAAAIKLLLP
ncbi:MAG: sulfite exporter TauE/SafE family protein [Phycisphaerae bacterium]|nr:sulfite exporter TauE/SafE family protein [Phycisphaerae bacterium]